MKLIKFNRQTKDYDMFYQTEYIGSRSTYQEAREELDRIAYEQLTREVAA
jgi:hypothetical protein